MHLISLISFIVFRLTASPLSFFSLYQHRTSLFSIKEHKATAHVVWWVGVDNQPARGFKPLYVAILVRVNAQMPPKKKIILAGKTRVWGFSRLEEG